MTAAGLPIDLRVGKLPQKLSPGLDLAVFRVIQEALTNVIKHAGQAAPRRQPRLPRTVSWWWRWPTPAGRCPRRARGPVPGTGRGLLGLRERVALYGGELDAGHGRAAGGWCGLRSR